MSARDLLAALPVELIGAAQQAIVAEGFHGALEGDADGNEEGAEHEEDEEEEDDDEGDEDEEVTAAADACPCYAHQAGWSAYVIQWPTLHIRASHQRMNLMSE